MRTASSCRPHRVMSNHKCDTHQMSTVFSFTWLPHTIVSDNGTELLHERGVWAILLGQWRQICKVSSLASFQQRSCGTRRSNCATWSAQYHHNLRGRTVNSAVEIPSLKTPPQTGLICYDHQCMLQKQLNHSTNNDTTRILPCALS